MNISGYIIGVIKYKTINVNLRKCKMRTSKVIHPRNTLAQNMLYYRASTIIDPLLQLTWSSLEHVIEEAFLVQSTIDIKLFVLRYYMVSLIL